MRKTESKTDRKTERKTERTAERTAERKTDKLTDKKRERQRERRTNSRQREIMQQVCLRLYVSPKEKLHVNSYVTEQIDLDRNTLQINVQRFRQKDRDTERERERERDREKNRLIDIEKSCNKYQLNYWVAIIMPKLKERNNVEMQKMNTVAKI